MSLPFARGAQWDGWLYFPGDLEASLLERMRREAFRGSRFIYHPGLFRRPAAFVVYRLTFKPSIGAQEIGFETGFEGSLLYQWEGLNPQFADPRGGLEAHAIELPPSEKARTLQVTMNVKAGLACLRLLGEARNLCERVEVSEDGAARALPTIFQSGLSDALPHEERLPVSRLEPCSVSDDCMDFGVQRFGYFESQSAQMADLHVGESREEVSNRDAAYQEQNLIWQPLEDGRFRSNPVAFRYVSSDEPVQTFEQMLPLELGGQIEAEESWPQAVYEAAAHTLRLCMRELVVDGIKRDRLPWAGDLYVSVLTNAVSWNEPESLRRTLVALAPHQPDRLPANGILDYNLQWLLSLERYIAFWGDEETLESLWNCVLHLLKDLEGHVDERGLLRTREHEWLFIDWLGDGQEGGFRPEKLAALQMLYCKSLLAVAKLAERVNDRHCAERCQERAEHLLSLWKPLLWSEQKACWLGEPGGEPSRHANFLALLAGWKPDGESPASWAARTLLRNDLPQVRTPYMQFFEILALQYAGLIPESLKRVNDYWGRAIAGGFTSFPEAYDPDESRAESLAFYNRPYGRSLCHAWSSGAAYLLTAGIVGPEAIDQGACESLSRRELLPDKWSSLRFPLGALERVELSKDA